MPTKVVRAAFTMPTLNRAHLHEQAYEQFRRQRGVAGHLYVFDESPKPSPFFTRWRHDVTYVHRPGSRPDGVTRIGAARNALTRMVREPVILHLDDDDELDPLYGATMLERLGDADVAKLDVWNIRHADWAWQWDTRRVGGLHFAMRGDIVEAVRDVAEDMTPEEREAFADAFRLGFGWSLCYRTEIARRFPFPERGTEDIPWMRQIRDAGARIVFVSDCAHLALHTVSNNPSHAEGGSPHWPQRLLGRVKGSTIGAGATMQELPQGQPIKVVPGETYKVRALIRKSHTLQSVMQRAESWGLHATSAEDNVTPQPGETEADGYRIVEIVGTGESALTIPWEAPRFFRAVGEKSRVLQAWVGAGASADDEAVIVRAWVGAGTSLEDRVARLHERRPDLADVEYVEPDQPKPRADGHVCSAASSQTVARQLDPRWTYVGTATREERDRMGLLRAIITSPVGGKKNIPTWVSHEAGCFPRLSTYRLVLQCPHSGALFMFRLDESREAGAAAEAGRKGGMRDVRESTLGPRGRMGAVGAAGVSSYFTQNADGSYSVNTDGVAAALDEKTPNFGDALEKGLVAGLAVEAVVDIAVGAVAYATTAGAAAAAATTAAAVAGSTTATATLTSAGAAAGAGLLAVPFVLAAVLLTAWPAQAGPGCCGTDTGQPFGSCDPGEFNDWNRQPWTQQSNPPFWAIVHDGSAEEFLNTTVQTVFSKTATCWSVAPPLGPVLLRAVAAWNAAHAPTTKRTISRSVNNTVSSTFGGQTSQVAGQPYSSEPIAVALNELALCGSGICGNADPSKGPVPDVSPPQIGATMSFTVNDGPLVSPGQLRPVKMNPPKSQSGAGVHPAAKIALGVGGAAALTAAGVGVFALVEGIGYREAWGRLWSKLVDETRASGGLLTRSVPRLP